MRGVATTTREWWLSGGLEQWRRCTGILRAHLLTMPLSAFVDPDGAQTLSRLSALAEHRHATAEVAVGYWGRRALVRLSLLPWGPTGVTVLEVAPTAPLPVSSWWAPVSEYAGYPPTPHSCTA